MLTQDEVGKIASLVNHTLDIFRETVRGIGTRPHSLDDSAKALDHSSEQIAGSADQQHQAASAMAAALEELAVGVSSISDSAKEAASMAQRSDEVAVEGGRIVE